MSDYDWKILGFGLAVLCFFILLAFGFGYLCGRYVEKHIDDDKDKQ